MLATTDLCDAHEDKILSGEVRILSPLFQSFGQKKVFSGPVATLKLFEDNSLVREALETPGSGKILFVDGGGSFRCALFGGNLAVLASKNGWSGLVVNGCIRDVDEINDCEIGVRALASHPVKSFKRGGGEKDVVVTFAGVRIVPGDWCYVDSDGIIVSSTQLSKL